jgi:predicted MFS family arabinose efflux permease
MSTSRIITRDFIYAFFSQFAFSAGYFILIPTLPVYLSKMKINELEIGILIGVFSVSSLVFRPFVGKGLLRIPERTFMVSGALLFALTSVAYLFAPPFWPFFMVRVFQGIGLAFFFTASTTLIANISPEDRRGQILSYFLITSNVAFAITPSLGIYLINRYGFTLLFWFCTVISLSAFYLSILLEKREVIPFEAPPIKSKAEAYFSRKALPPSIMAFFIHMIWGSLIAFFPLYAIEHGVTNPGIFFTIFAVILILCRTLGSKLLDRYSREMVILPCLINYILTTLLLAFSRTLPMFILVAVIWGIGTAFVFPALVALTLDLAGSARGPAIGTFTAFSDLGVGLGAVMMGIVIRWTNYQVMFFCLALIGFVNVLYLISLMRKKREI